MCAYKCVAHAVGNVERLLRRCAKAVTVSVLNLFSLGRESQSTDDSRRLQYQRKCEDNDLGVLKTHMEAAVVAVKLIEISLTWMNLNSIFTIFIADLIPKSEYKEEK